MSTDKLTGNELTLAAVKVTATGTELNFLDIATLGTGLASKAMVLDSSSNYTYPGAGTLTMPASSTFDVAGTFQIGGVTTASTAAELTYLDLGTLGTGAASKAVVLDTGEDYTWPSGGVLTYGVLADASTTIGASAAEINAAADVSARYIDIGATGPYTVLVANSGKSHMIPQVTGGNIAITLPAVSAGLEYTFRSVALSAEGDNWVITATTDFQGGLAQVDTDGSSAAVHAAGSSTNTCTIVAPLAGTTIHMICDGTNWLVSGFVLAVAVPTFTEV